MHTWGLSVLLGETMAKEFRTIDEQLEILKSRGLSIPEYRYGHMLIYLQLQTFHCYTLSAIIRSRKKISEEYGLKHNKSPQVLGNFLHGITIIRNLCAHDSRLFNRLFITKPDLNKKELALLVKNQNGNPDNSRLFGYILIIKRLLSSDEFLHFKNKLITLCSCYPFVEMRYYGFRSDCKDLI